MDAILQHVKSPAFWLDVIVFGLVIGVSGSLAAAYIKEPLDRLFSRFSARCRTKRAAVEKAHLQLVATLKRSDRKTYFARHLEMRYLMLSAILFAMTTLFLLVSWWLAHMQPPPYLIAYLLILLTIMMLFQVMRVSTKAGRYARAVNDSMRTDLATSEPNNPFYNEPSLVED